MEPSVNRRWIGSALALAVFGLACLGEASAAESSGGWVASVRGVGRAPVPPDTAVAVVARDFSDVNTRLQPVLEQALVAHGFRVDPNAPLQLVYSTQLTNPAGTSATGYEVGDIGEERVIESEGKDTGPHPAQFEDVVPQVRIPLGRGDTASLSDYALSFVVGAPGQTPLWTGGVTVALPPRDPLAVAQAMVPVLVPQIGRTVDTVQAFSD